MRPILSYSLILLLLLCSSWGFFAHQRINELAIFTLPYEMSGWFKTHLRYIKSHAIDPDKRRYADSLEAPRHYLDVEHYSSTIDSIPHKWNDAVEKYGIKFLNKNGIVPWHIQRVYFNLVKAFKDRNANSVLHYAADLGHYIGDAHVPLHTTSNHNGQLTNQNGLHAFWESRLPELFSGNYNFIVGKAIYIDDPLIKAWQIVKHTRSLVDSVLTIEAELNAAFPSDKKYSFSPRGNTILKQYSEEYAHTYQQNMNGMVEKQMRAAILAIGSYWYSAWVDAGQPDLKQLKEEAINKDTARRARKEEEKFKKGVLIGREL